VWRGGRSNRSGRRESDRGRDRAGRPRAGPALRARPRAREDVHLARRGRGPPGGVRGSGPPVRRPEEVLVVVHRRGRSGLEFLVLERSPERQGYWHLVAGALDQGEDAAAAAARELGE